MRHAIYSLAISLSCIANSAAAQPIAAAASSPELGYADLTDLAVAAPIVVRATIAKAVKVSNDEAPGVPAGHQRFFVTAEVGALLRGTQGLPAEILYLVDAPLDQRGRAPKLKKKQVLLLARPVQGRTGEIQLVAPDAQLDWTPTLEQRLRGILTDLVNPDLAPTITGIGSAFHVPGAIPGESETQIFLKTADSRPVSLAVLRRPGEQVRWAVALAEMVDEAAEPPARDTLLWYRLACALPRRLPESSVASLDAAGAIAAQQDYTVVIEGLGRCVRNRTVR